MTFDRGVEEDLDALADWTAELVARGEEEDVGETEALLYCFAELLAKARDLAAPEILERLRPIFLAAGMDQHQAERCCDDFVAALAERLEGRGQH